MKDDAGICIVDSRTMHYRSSCTSTGYVWTIYRPVTQDSWGPSNPERTRETGIVQNNRHIHCLTDNVPISYQDLQES